MTRQPDSTSADPGRNKTSQPRKLWVNQIARFSASAIMPLTTYSTPARRSADGYDHDGEPLRLEALPERAGERHAQALLGLLLEADEPEAMLARLKRLAECKARYAIRGALVDRQAAERWLRLAEALVTVERQVIASKD